MNDAPATSTERFRLDAMARLSLPPRGPRASEANMERSILMNTATRIISAVARIFREVGGEGWPARLSEGGYERLLRAMVATVKILWSFRLPRPAATRKAVDGALRASAVRRRQAQAHATEGRRRRRRRRGRP